MTIHVVAPGAFTTVQDLGRYGYAAAGVPPSGAMDPVALRAANRLAGNPDDAAALEITLELVERLPVGATGKRAFVEQKLERPLMQLLAGAPPQAGIAAVFAVRPPSLPATSASYRNSAKNTT